MLKLMVKRIDNVIINDFELNNNIPSYTWNTIKYLKSQYLIKKITIALGADLFKDINNWYKIEKIKKEVTFLCFNRKNYIIDNIKKHNVIFIDDYKYNISSSIIRDAILNGKMKEINNLMDQSVYNYIMNIIMFYKKDC